MASDAAEKIVMLPASNKRDALDYECPRTPGTTSCRKL
jgi:hypothetical protein